ncbi:MAG: sulfatase/phosphatase domain-containing protein, partial [Chitinophagales bacterium]
IMGEHHLYQKQLAYENSIRIPIFMRYPKLINAGTHINNQVAMNIDIAPTILDFAGIEDTFGMQGISLLKLYTGEETRTEMLYEFHHHHCVPDLRAVRSMNAKYIQYYCSDTTEEYFDLTSDMDEVTNQIFNSGYSDSVQVYRDKMSFWRNYYGDNTWDSLYTCNLYNIQQRSTLDSTSPFVLFNIFPNPSSEHFTLHFISSEASTSTIHIFNTLGILKYLEIISTNGKEITRGISTCQFPSGNYFAVVHHGENIFKKAFSIR